MKTTIRTNPEIVTEVASPQEEKRIELESVISVPKIEPERAPSPSYC